MGDKLIPKTTKDIKMLQQPPQKEKGVNMPTQDVQLPNIVHQADILYTTSDDTKLTSYFSHGAKEDKRNIPYKYILVVSDMGSSHVDAQPLKSTDQQHILDAFKAIYSRHKFLKMPQLMIQLDQDRGFKGIIHEYFNKNGVIVKYIRAGRHRQNAQVEAFNNSLGRKIATMQHLKEYKTGEENTEWVKDLYKFLLEINKGAKKRRPKKEDKPPSCSGISCKLLQEGQKVLIPKEFPTDINEKRLPPGQKGIWRAGDIRWDNKIRTIKQLVLRPNQPPLYRIEGVPMTAYTRQQLKPV